MDAAAHLTPASPHGGCGSAGLHARLVERVARLRDRDAFARLYAYYAPRLNSFLRGQGLEAAPAEELVQECLLTLWRRADGYRPEQAAVSTWLYTIARNLCIDRFRRERRIAPTPVIEDSHSVELATEEATLREHTEQAVLHEERAEQLRRAIELLPAEQAAVLGLFYFQSMTTAEISAFTGISVGTVKSRMRLALDRLRASIEE